MKKMTERTTNEITSELKTFFEQRVKPAVAQDGGEIDFLNFSDGVVYVEMKGACVGCPSSTATLKYGLENMLRYYFPEVDSVEDINDNGSIGTIDDFEECVNI